uniref:Beta-N-acetylhexosaminidase n=1 Tax=Leptospirillum ferriphilum TaxID=178606 RepID=A0A7C3QRH4_9BACT
MISRTARKGSDVEWGQWLWVSLPGTSLGKEDILWLKSIRPGGVVLFSENGTRADDVRRLVSSVREALAPSDVWIAIDQEGGRVARLKEGVPRIPPARELGDRGDPAEIFRTGLELGQALRKIGIDIDFAPVLDVDSNPVNPVIGDRSFSQDPYLAARFGMAFSRGLEAGGVVPCGKHYPGHGDTLLDSHLALPTVKAPLSTLQERELLPFEVAALEGIPMMMTAHVIYPALDNRWPATLSHTVLSGYLRKKWGYGGVVVSDDLSMAAVGHPYRFRVVVERALAASCDGLLVLKSREKPLEAMEILQTLVSKNPGSWQRRFERSRERRERVGKLIARYRAAGDR